jgi:hypothetical protein
MNIKYAYNCSFRAKKAFYVKRNFRKFFFILLLLFLAIYYKFKTFGPFKHKNLKTTRYRKAPIIRSGLKKLACSLRRSDKT